MLPTGGKSLGCTCSDVTGTQNTPVAARRSKTLVTDRRSKTRVHATLHNLPPQWIQAVHKLPFSRLRRKRHKLTVLLPAPVAPKHHTAALQLHRRCTGVAEPLRGLPPDRHVCLPAVFVADVSITQAADGAGGLLDAALDQACCGCGLRHGDKRVVD